MNGSQIHSTAIISKNAKIGENVIIGPYCVIGDNVEIGNNNTFHSHVVVTGPTKIGTGNIFFPFGSIGADPQDYSYKGEPTRLEIGDNNTFRECVTLNRGTLKQDQVTIIGSNNLLMAYVHVGHDTVIKNQCTIANSCNIAGHVVINNKVIIGGNCGVSQFVTVGQGAYIGGASAIVKDIPPFCYAVGNRVKLKGVNIVGMKRAGIAREVISEVVDFYRTMEESALAPSSFVKNEEFVKEYANNEIVQEMIKMIASSEVGIPSFHSE